MPTKPESRSTAVVIIPTYNEKGNIAAAIQALSEVFAQIKHYRMLALVVDDSSPDGTAEVVRQLQQQHKFLKLLVNPRKSGLGGAYLAGMKEAFSTLQAEVVFEFDADLSHDPSKIPAFLDKLDAGADLVLGSRYIKGGSIPANWGLDRKFLSICGNLFINFLMFDFSIRDWTTGFRAIRKRVYQAVEGELHGKRFSGYTFQIGFLHKALRKGFKIAEVPFHFKDRTIGHSKIGPEYIKNTLLYLLKIRFKELTAFRAVRFAMVGGFGALVQLTALQLWRLLFTTPETFVVASFLAIETAVISNFIWSNLWTFKDRKLTPAQVPLSFVKFNLSSGGSIAIQSAIAFFGARWIGLFDLFEVPIIHYMVDTGVIFAIIGILIGMTWNFFAYTSFIWKKQK